MYIFKQGWIYASAIGLCLAGVGSTTFAATYSIQNENGLVTPSFRGQAGSNWFGWAPGTFDGASDNELIDSPPQTLNLVDPPVGYALVQNSADDILSGSNNIYTAGFSLDLTLTAPTSGTLGSGFTTIIVQGRTLFGGFPSGAAGPDLVFADLEGVSPSYAQATNASGMGQFWAKYEIPGNLASYAMNITSSSAAVSIAELQVDTLWSASAFAPDTAVVPEPATALLALCGAAALVMQVRRQRGCQ